MIGMLLRLLLITIKCDIDNDVDNYKQKKRDEPKSYQIIKQDDDY